jgi:hypothetical protein
MNIHDTRIHNLAADQVRVFMRRHKLALADLINIGGEDLKSPDYRKAERARHVSQTWQMMARLSVCFTDLEGNQNEIHT